MPERIDRKTDENLYQPKIHSVRIRQLYVLKTITGLPMTVLADLAIQELVGPYKVSKSGNENRGRTYSAE